MKNKAFTLVELLVVIAIIVTLGLALLGIGLVGCAGCKAVKSVSENGLKGTATEIWEGPKKSLDK